MTGLLNVARQVRKSFRKHFLVSVHSEIGFSALPLESILSAQQALENILRNLGFIECRQVIQGQFTFETKADESAKLSQEASPLGLLFISQTPRRELQILSNRLIYSDFSYDGFEDFLSRLRDLWGTIAPVIGLTEQHLVNKIGLRKINSIVMEPVSSFQDALSIFNSALFSIARSGLVIKEAFKVTEEVTVLDDRDGNICLLRTKLQKRNENGLEANLDFDLVRLSENNFAKTFADVLPALNQSHFDLFLWAITAELIKLMEAE